MRAARARSSPGVVLVAFALLVPLLSLLAFGIVEYGFTTTGPTTTTLCDRC